MFLYQIAELIVAQLIMLRILKINKILVSSKHTLPDLPYDFNALEPTISADIMKLHYLKHHAAYVNNLNVAEEKFYELKGKNDLSNMIEVTSALKFNGGGHINHSIFWKNLSPQGGGQPGGMLLEAIKKTFGSFDKFKQEVSTKAVGVQGSGWAWLGLDKNKALKIATCLNQDPLEAITGLKPLLGIDVWEHAYYLQYKNMRPDYVKAIWDKINWKFVEEQYEKSIKP